MSYRYIENIRNLINKIEQTQGEKIEMVSHLCAEAIEKEKVLYFFGTGHSHMICEEPFYRAGGLVPVNPIFLSTLMLHEGVMESTYIERLEGLSTVLFNLSGAGEGDIMFVISNSGVNNTPIEMATRAKEKGIKVVAMTNVEHSKVTPSRHREGKKLYEVADIVLDNCGVPGDASVEIPNLKQKVGPTSTAACVLILNTIITRTVEILVDKGINPPVFMSSNIVGGEEHNNSMIEKYKSRVRML